ncbi:MAG: thioredoxin family protein [Phycisphaerae bacterium]|nr:thioredoxin family protein [Phycisphaerae bacterium]
MTNILFRSLFAGVVSLSLCGGAYAQSTPTTPPPAKDDHKDHDHSDHDHKDHKHDKKDKKKAETAKIGESAPEFALKDTAGKTVSLADFKGKIVVLEWFNADCPFIVKHHKNATTFNDLHTKYNGKGVVFLAICSSAEGNQGSGVERNAKAKTDFKMEYPILMDADGKVGKTYGAKTTPHCFVIAADGKLVYNGAIDDDKSTDPAGKTNYVAKAIDELLAGKPVSTPTTKPYGCSVKY